MRRIELESPPISAIDIGRLCPGSGPIDGAETRVHLSSYVQSGGTAEQQPTIDVMLEQHAKGGASIG